MGSPAKSGDETSEAEERRDTISILGSSLLQPIADHIDKLLLHEVRDRPSHGENGYAAMLVVEFSILLESYIARLRYTRKQDVVRNASLTTQLSRFFADLPELGSWKRSMSPARRSRTTTSGAWLKTGTEATWRCW